MLVADFDFRLPDELIAQEAAPRGGSRLMVLDRHARQRHHLHVSDLPQWLRPGDLLVVNDTQVFAARLLGIRVPSGGAVECLLLSAEPTAGRDIYSALMHPGQKLKPGAVVAFTGDAGTLIGQVVERHFHGRRTIRLWSEAATPVDRLIDALGHIPLPPYIKRDDSPDDRERYQTVYARVRGSIAAPTAGLHFSGPLLEAVARRGVERVAITLHVGYGTFKPVTVERVEDHVVLPEPYWIDEATALRLNRARDDHRRIIAVGTTTTRALEDAFARGGGRFAAGAARAERFIHPAAPPRVIDGLMTNFHLPRSSLLMLVAAFGGHQTVMAAYADAVARRYRFYSYGDAMLIV